MNVLRLASRSISSGPHRYFLYQNVPAPPNMADPYPRLSVDPFQLPLGVSIVRDANGAPSWRRADGTTFSPQSPFSPKSNTFIDPLVETPYQQQWSASLQYEAARQLLVDLRYVGSRGVGLLGKVNLSLPVDPRVTPVNGFTDIYDRLGRVINPDFFVPPQFLGLDNNGGFQQLTIRRELSIRRLLAKRRRLAIRRRRGLRRRRASRTRSR